MKRKTKLILMIWVLPFMAGATLEFLPAWVKWPAFLLESMFFIGACIQLVELKEEDEK